MIDWRCTTTSIRSGSTPKRWPASIISSALLNIEAESIEMRAPIDQFGCATACFGLAAAICSSVQVRNGPPLAVSSSRSIGALPLVLAGDQLEDRVVLAVDRQQMRPGARHLGQEQRPRGDQALLVGERDRRALPHGRQRRAQPRRADDRRHDPVGGARRRLLQRLGPGRGLDAAAGQRVAQRAIAGRDRSSPRPPRPGGAPPRPAPRHWHCRSRPRPRTGRARAPR